MAKKVKSLDEWRKMLENIEDSEEEEDKNLQERVKRGSKMTSSMSGLAQGSSLPAKEVNALNRELNKNISSLSVKEAREAVRQAEVKMQQEMDKLTNNNDEDKLKNKTNGNSKKKKKKKSETKTNQQKMITQKDHPETPDMLSPLQLEMKKMMETLQQVTAAAEKAKQEAQVRQDDVEKMRMEVDLAQKKSDEEKVKMEESFNAMSVGLREEALAHKEELLEDVGNGKSLFEAVDNQIDGSNMSHSNKHVSIEPQFGLEFNKTGQINTTYTFLTSHKGDDNGNIECDNIGCDGDYIAVFKAPSKKQKMIGENELTKPDNLGDYLDFNYIDESAENWQRAGKVEVSISAKQRNQPLLVCYISDEECLASAILSPSTSIPSSSSSLTSSPTSSQMVPSSQVDDLPPQTEDSESEVDEENNRLSDMLSHQSQLSDIILEDLNSIQCYKLFVPLAPSQSSPMARFDWLRDLIKSLPPNTTTNVSEEDAEFVNAIYSQFGLSCNSTMVTLKYPILSPQEADMKKMDDVLEKNNENNGRSGSRTLELDLSEMCQEINTSLVSLRLTGNDKDGCLEIRLPYKRIKPTQGYKKQPINSNTNTNSTKEEDNSTDNSDNSIISNEELLRHEARIDARKQARIARSRAARKEFSSLALPPLAHERSQLSDNKNSFNAFQQMGRNETTIPQAMDQEQRDLTIGKFYCCFCDAVLVEKGSLTSMSPAPVGILEDICDDLMCSACPVIDLSTIGVLPSLHQTMYSNQAFLFQSKAVVNGSIIESPFQHPLLNFTGCKSIQCARCLVPIGETLLPSLESEEEDDDDADDDKDNGRGIRLFRHRIACEFQHQTMASPYHQPDTYLSSFLIANARKSNIFTFQIHKNGQSKTTFEVINLKLISWTSLLASVNDEMTDKLEQKLSSNNIQLISLLKQIVKVEFSYHKSIQDVPLTSLINAEMNKIDVVLENDEFEYVLKSLQTNMKYCCNVPVTLDKTKKLSFLRVASDFE
mmetsp:Transcript_11515/g.13878  ORF Transcript_11515/g.13878 Transcript_11515/m.13878 type:complete len:993 (-) Transcript_11515:76-3054(-)